MNKDTVNNEDSFEYRFLDFDRQEFVRTEIDLVERFRDCGDQCMTRALFGTLLSHMVIVASAEYFSEDDALMVLLRLDGIR